MPRLIRGPASGFERFWSCPNFWIYFLCPRRNSNHYGSFDKLSIKSDIDGLRLANVSDQDPCVRFVANQTVKLNSANPQVRSMRGNEFFVAKLDGVPSQFSLATGCKPKRQRETGDENGSDRRECPIVLVNELALAQQEYPEAGTTRDRVIELSLFGVALFVGIFVCAFLIRR